ncbi:DUF421 domain-containing protein [Paenibacillus sp. 1011MAR3C5]|uniref:DUF421 domain-containing protein n=1 Tax=Paenibacillus sp. 1011MAR3C5 TaxID=1675787 RepID=UPI000E6C5F29|nr:DUF421 domain-containing protein [Paenibacillus sp. 1011MAR3C5]RJE87763.1 DUF421 domain-containing protein [Paenibacillus sp. 1011MAR3C5]
MPDWLEIVLRTLASIVILFILTKVLGKRQISELSLFEYITGISIGNIAAYISLDLDNLWYLGIVSLVVWVSVSVGIELWTLKSRRLRNVVDGRGTVLIRNGQLSKQKLRKERITLDELLEQLRQKDVYRVADVEFAVMEPSGELNVQLKKEHQPLTPSMLGWTMSKESQPLSIIMDGHIIKEELQLSGHSEDWVKHELKRHKLKLQDVFLAQLDSDGQMTFQTPDGRIYPEPSSTSPKDRVMSLTGQLQEELRRLEQLSQSDKDRRTYESALYHLNQGIDAMRLKKGTEN